MLACCNAFFCVYFGLITGAPSLQQGTTAASAPHISSTALARLLDLLLATHQIPVSKYVHY
jgi:hypothetical protein